MSGLCYDILLGQPLKFLHIGKGIAILVQAYYRHRAFQEVKAPRFQDTWKMKVVRLSALCTSRLYSPRNYSWHSFMLEALSTPGPQCSQKDWCQQKIPKTPSMTRMELQFHPGRAWKLSSNLHDIYQCRMYCGKLPTMGRVTARNV